MRLPMSGTHPVPSILQRHRLCAAGPRRRRPAEAAQGGAPRPERRWAAARRARAYARVEAGAKEGRGHAHAERAGAVRSRIHRVVVGVLERLRAGHVLRAARQQLLSARHGGGALLWRAHILRLGAGGACAHRGVDPESIQWRSVRTAWRNAMQRGPPHPGAARARDPDPAAGPGPLGRTKEAHQPAQLNTQQGLWGQGQRR